MASVVPPGGVASLPSLADAPAYRVALQAAQQQGGEGFVDADFTTQFKNPSSGRMESNGKIIYISGQPASNAGSASKVDSWTRMKVLHSAAAAADDAGGSASKMHARPQHLDDTWLLSALAIVGGRPELIARIHAADQTLGVHCVRLYKDGEAKGVAPEWMNVVIDDQIPCHGKKKPIYSTNVDPGAGPVCAIQKALAKMYGCYEHLAGGRVGSALEDLTGGIADKLYLRDGIAGADGAPKQPHLSAAEATSGGTSSAMWKRLHDLLANGHLAGATYKAKYAESGDEVALPIKPPPAAKMSGASGASGTAHVRKPPVVAYPILELKEVDGNGYVKLGNPWAKIGDDAAPEYKGDWGPSSISWQNEQSIAKELGGRPRDGAFWMTYESFLKGFNKVYVCYLPHTPSTTNLMVEGEWTSASAGGRLSAAPGAKWRSNPQYKLTVSEKCTVLIALSQQDSQTDANDSSDAYPHAIGFHLIGGPPRGERRTLSYSDGPLFSSRYANSRQVCRVLELDPSDEATSYSLMPATWDPNVYMPYTLTLASSAPVTLEPIAVKEDYIVTNVLGAWSTTAKTVGGCPNFQESWTSNPQIRLTTSVGGQLGIGVLSLSMPEAELKKLQAQHELDESAGKSESILSIGVLIIPIADAETGKAPASNKPALKKRLTSVALSGAMALEKDAILCSSSFVAAAKEQAVVSIDLPAGPGSYLIVPTTYFPGQEANFSLTIYHTDPKLSLTPLKGARLPPPPVFDLDVANSKNGGKGQSSGKGKIAPPIAKHDVAATRAANAANAASAAGGGGGGGATDELGDDGKMGYAQRMELEEQMRLSKHPENVPLFTVEGAPLSENVKKEKDRLVALALAYCERTGGKFEDSGPGGFPEAVGDAAGPHQPHCYRGGKATGSLPKVASWKRPEDFAPDAPVMFRNDYSVEGIIQAEGFDNRWFISSLNIVSGNRGQLDRIFFGELSDEWMEKGFFVCKFYADDPLSDDDWAVVLVDDRIPCKEDGTPAFCRNPDPNVYWAMIIEKAYAKMVGSYEAMQGGTVTQGLEDMTGGIGYKFDLEKRERLWIPALKSTDPPEPDRDESKLWFEMLEKMMTEHVVGCANNTKGQDRPQSTKKGIELNRAYAVVTGGEFEDHRLMKLRIPLAPDGGAREWNGRWSDGAPQWNNRLRQMLAYSSDDSDGTFWMEYKDFCRHYNKVYMCRMLDDLWTRITVKSRWMDETAGGCTNYISWRNNNQWLLTVTRPNTKLTIKLSQPDARKSSGNGRHYSNAIGFYIFKGNSPNKANDHKRRKLILTPGDEEDGGDFVFCKEPRFSKQVITEYTFEKASPVPYIIMPFIFEPGREQLFRFTMLSDDRDDDGEPDFLFQEIKPGEDWKRQTVLDAFHKGGKGNPLKKYNLQYQGDKGTAGGPLEGATWTKNSQFQLTLSSKTRVFIFLEARNVKTDMRDVEGLQTEPAYPTMGFVVCKGKGNHQLLEDAPEVLYKSEVKFGDGVYLELGLLEPLDDKYIVIPFTESAGEEHEYAITLYSDVECVIEKVDPDKAFNGVPCIKCTNPLTFALIRARLASLESKYNQILKKEARLKAAGKFGKPRPHPEMSVAAEAGLSSTALKAVGENTDPALLGLGLGVGVGAQLSDAEGKVSLEDMQTFKRYGESVETDAKGNVIASSMKRVSDDLQKKKREQLASYQEVSEQAEIELKEGKKEIEVLMELLKAAQAAPHTGRKRK